MLSFYKSLGFPERHVNTLLCCSQYSVLSQRGTEWPQGVCVRLVKKLRRNSFFLKRNFLLNTVSKNTILSLVKCQEALFLLPINFAAIAAAHSAQHTACASPADDPSHLEVITWSPDLMCHFLPSLSFKYAQSHQFTYKHEYRKQA